MRKLQILLYAQIWSTAAVTIFPMKSSLHGGCTCADFLARAATSSQLCHLTHGTGVPRPLLQVNALSALIIDSGLQHVPSCKAEAFVAALAEAISKEDTRVDLHFLPNLCGSLLQRPCPGSRPFNPAAHRRLHLHPMHLVFLLEMLYRRKLASGLQYFLSAALSCMNFHVGLTRAGRGVVPRSSEVARGGLLLSLV